MACLRLLMALVHNDGESRDSESVSVTSGVKQDCVMSPTLFSMMFSAMLTESFQDSDTSFNKVLLRG